MPIGHAQVRAALDPDEPDYRIAAANLGPEALPHLEAIIHGPDRMLASKAVYLAGLIPHERSTVLLEQAALSDDPDIRAAVAGTARNLPEPDASRVLLPLVIDEDR